ncbi:mitogen-activated protein kinase kinase kinase 7-interacting protein 3 homolog isoform X2 [Belonocnema kinseyi]|uniref:mitogen-activated protein kinase kinase kinase 7-interacting protein 3 homolog isoform X2 n=1 Tax=Belonocnema kinseyi TaxID=2817044 RepID=UPI00143CE78F|nr:mitogen-activated protein kinase kinase kinase 7-interacting protein 3 homolog isoform X2 [Belonocnema kinseyi]
MGDCNCSKIAKMQLFHELKQQFPTLSDSIVKDCIKENGHDRETCAKTLRATENRRPSRGAFPPPAQNSEPVQLGIMKQKEVAISPASTSRPHRPATLDFELRRPSIGCTRVPPINNHFNTEVFDDTSGAERTGFELNVNVECSPVKNRVFGSPPGASRRSDIVFEPRSYTEPYMNVNPAIQVDQTRSFTSVSLTLRPPSSDPQPPIEIRSQGSSLTYSTSSSDPRGFQSSVQISVAAARIRPPMAPTRPSNLIPSGQFSSLRQPAGLPPGPPSQLSRPTMTMSAPTTPSVPTMNLIVPSTSSPTTPLVAQAIKSPPQTPEKEEGELVPSSSNQVTESQRQLIAEQLERKERLARDVLVEKEKLEAIKKEMEMLLRPLDPLITPEVYRQKLHNEISQLRNQCNKLTNEIDQRSLPGVPLGETNEEFYQGIYTGQPFVPRLSNLPPPLPLEPPAWQRPGPSLNREDREEGWICRMCTFKNHPLMKRCEQCELPRIMPPFPAGETQDIHIRVTHHHNFSPRRTVRSWVV